MAKSHDKLAASKKNLLVHGRTGCGKSAWLRATSLLDRSPFGCTVTAADVWRSWEHGEPEAALVQAFSAAAGSQPKVLYIDDIDLICATSQTSESLQPVLLRLVDILARLAEGWLGVSVVATCTDVARLPARLLTAQRFGTQKALADIVVQKDTLSAHHAAACGSSPSAPPACVAPPRAVSLSSLHLAQPVLEQLRVECILPLVTCTADYKGDVKPLACGGVLLHGSTGNGKTALAHAVANTVAASGRASAWVVDAAALTSKYVGETEGMLHAVFAFARSQSPCLLVLDGIDSLVPATARGNVTHTASRTWDRVLSTLLTELDGMHSKGQQVALLATAGSPKGVHEALRRPGRLGTHISLTPPSEAQLREHAAAWLQKHGAAVCSTVLDHFLQHTQGLSHAQVAALLSKAAQRRVRAAMASDSAMPSADMALQATLIDLSGVS